MTQNELNLALFAAAETGNAKKAAKLIAEGAQADAYNAGLRPMYYAVTKGHKDVVELLIENGAQVNVKDAAGQQPLDYAVWSGSRDMVELLLDHGANPEDLKIHYKDHEYDGQDEMIRPTCDDEDIEELLQRAEREWADPELREKRKAGEQEARLDKARADVSAQQRKLGALRPKGPSL